MLPMRNVEDLQNLNEAVSLQNQVKAVRLQDKPGEQNYHEDAKKNYLNRWLMQLKIPLTTQQKL